MGIVSKSLLCAAMLAASEAWGGAFEPDPGSTPATTDLVDFTLNDVLNTIGQVTGAGSSNSSCSQDRLTYYYFDGRVVPGYAGLYSAFVHVSFCGSPNVKGRSVAFTAIKDNQLLGRGYETLNEWCFTPSIRWIPGSNERGQNFMQINASYINDIGQLEYGCEIYPFTVQNAPIAQAGGPYTGKAGQSVSFNGNATIDSYAANPSGSYSWTFGDGSAAVPGKNVTHTYSSPGTYAVKLTVSDGYFQNASQTTATIATSTGGCPNTRLVHQVCSGYSGAHPNGTSIVIPASGDYNGEPFTGEIYATCSNGGWVKDSTQSYCQ